MPINKDTETNIEHRMEIMNLNHRTRKPKTKMTDALVEGIKLDLADTKLTQNQIAEKHDVSAPTVSRILKELRKELS
ncbi:winged helix-turn-helix transcriptional regulator [Photobacterium carnosum]|uniref:winged helix-turn-helix transcriptional regulator n=1 Tax=Photobacterium carnosum TaxID=2023717 RepID=UPI001E58C444|nr:winged helix-turn-helix transcriptional regulator [Photobacterium carnosum]MCD9498859.1 winged helix-turn-helix transcriptional regulator [Photobacterium carnosum]